MRPSSIVIAVVWIWSLAGALAQGLSVPRVITPPDHPSFRMVAPFILIFFFLFASTVPFFSRRLRPGRMPGLLERIWGPGAYERFLARFKPLTLMMLYGLILGLTGLLATLASTRSFAALFASGFFLSNGAGLLVAYLLSVRFPPRLS